MKKIILSLVRQFVFWILFFDFSRLVFLLFYAGILRAENVHFTEVLGVFWYSLHLLKTANQGKQYRKNSCQLDVDCTGKHALLGAVFSIPGLFVPSEYDGHGDDGGDERSNGQRKDEFVEPSLSFMVCRARKQDF